MKPLASPLEIAQHAESLRGLAMALVRDASAADDALQESVLNALRSPPRSSATTDAWFAQVLRNVVRKRWRRDASRRTREQAWAPRGTPEQPEQRLIRIEQASSLVTAMRSLTPLGREVIELRFFESLPPRKIAARLGVPVETVKSRIKRALADLRRELDGEHGAKWPVAWAPALGMTPKIVMGSSVPKVLIASLAAGLLAALGIAVWMDRTDDIDASNNSSSGRIAQANTEDDSSSASQLASRTATTLQGAGLPPLSGRDEPTMVRADNDPSEELWTLHGRIELEDASGRYESATSGTLTVTKIGDSSRTEVVVQIHEGRFSADMKADTLPQFRELIVNGRPAKLLGGNDTRPVPDNGTLVIRARRFAPLRLRAIDAVTGKLIPRIYAAFNAREDDLGTSPRPDQMHQFELQQNPVSLPLEVKAMRGHGGWRYVIARIGAEGYAWSSATIEDDLEREHTVELVRCGSVQIDLAGPELPPTAMLRIRPNRKPYVWIEAEARATPDASITFQRVRPGSYVARLEASKSSSGSGTCLGTRSFVVREGVHTQAALNYKSIKRKQRLRITGRLRIPIEWSIENPSILLNQHHAPNLLVNNRGRSLTVGRGLTPDPSEPGSFLFDSVALWSGTHNFRVEPSGYTGTLIVDPDHATDVNIDVPPPAIVRIRVEGEDELPKGLEVGIFWIPAQHLDSDWSSAESYTHRNGEGEFVLRIAQGEIIVWTEGEGYASDKTRVHVPSGGTRCTLQVQRTGHIHVRLMSDGQRLNYSMDWNHELTPLGRNGRLVTLGETEDRDGMIQVIAPGRYRIDKIQVPGFKPFAPLEVDVNPERPTEVTIQLERR